jgi:ribosomal protein S18 acetylase RimI-like enzyme
MAAYGPDRQGGDAELCVIYVLPAYWSKNVGRPLLDRVIEDMRARGYSRLGLWVLAGNERARRFL